MEAPTIKSTGDNVENKEVLKIRILIADDFPLNTEALKIILEAQGYIVKSVDNGQLLLDELKQNQYDLIITDNNMPLKTGVQALKEIRSGDEGTRKIPVIVLSGDLIEKKVKNLEGVYMGKPVDGKKLIQQINQLV
jgi:CheY-like chemotaxis protein